MDNNIKHIVFLVLPDATALDITGPLEVFSQTMEYLSARKEIPDYGYQLHLVSADRRKNVRTASGIVIHCHENIDTINYPIDTLIIPGVPNSLIDTYQLPSKALRWLHRQSTTAKRICSVCTGSFFLAEAGILDGKRVTTHWEKCSLLSTRFPATRVDDNPIFIKDGNVYTSAGISSGMDLALYLVEEDLGRTIALAVARQMVLYLKRPGSQSQYSSVLTHQNTDYQPVKDTCQYIQEHLHEHFTVEALAAEVSMSPRNFARVFVRETGTTPSRYIDKLRVETACRYLADTGLSLKEIAVLCGLSSPDNMRKVFLKHISISPSDYRKNFGRSFSAT